MNTYSKFSTRKTPQSKPIPGSSQVKNNAGGFAWEIDNWSRLDRFLILGSEGGTYYVKEQELTERNANSVIECIKEDGVRVVNRVVDVSEQGRAPKNDPALFVLAMCAGLGNVDTRKHALNMLPRVARIGTHLFHFLAYVENFRGWGRALRNGVSAWYNDKGIDQLAYQVVKYQQRDGWSHRDALRKAHPIAQDNLHNNLYNWITQGEVNAELPKIVTGVLSIGKVETAKQAVEMIEYYNLPREVIPTGFLNDVGVWDALLQKMPMTAMIRNLAKMTAIGLLKDWNSQTQMIVDRLNNQEYLQKSRIHPLSVLVALNTYIRGEGVRGSLTWEPITEIVNALDKAFYLSFGNVQPTNKRTMLALDVSGSMTLNDIAGMTGVTPAVGSAAMALITANVEPKHMFFGFGTSFQKLTISPRQRLDDVVGYVRNIRMGGTDCSLPMLYALQKSVDVDTFIIYTDNETWAGRMHPSQALQQYRQQSGINAKLAVVGMTSGGFSIADPNDAGMMDVVGFDTATPNILTAFAKGEI